MAEKQDHPQTTQASQPPPQNNSNGFGATAPIPRPADASKWSHSFWDCFEPVETFLCGWCLPCFLYGKTSARLQDPSMQSDYAANGDCCVFALLSYCGCQWIVLMQKRGEIRKRFGIEGSGGQDCAESFFCPCCALVQHEKEVETRSGAVQAPYQAPAGMTYSQ